MDWLKRSATGASLVGASLLAGNIGLAALAFALMIFSSVSFIVAFWKKETEVVVLNAGFLMINLVGLWRAL